MSKLLAGRTIDYEFEGEVFKLKVLSGEADDRVRAITTAYEKATPEQKPALRDEAIKLCVAEWPWSGTLRSVLSDRDCWQLVGAAVIETALKGIERKKSESQPCSETDSSVDTDAVAT